MNATPLLPAPVVLLLSIGAVTAGSSAAGERDALPEPENPRPVGQTPGCWIRTAPEDLELRISPLDSTSVRLSGGTVKVCYSQPRKVGRPIMGRLVPFGEPWRLGANEATAIHLPAPAVVAGVEVSPGSYSLYAVPGPEEWRIVVNEETRRWGIPIDEEVRSSDVGSGSVPVERLAETVEMLTMHLNRTSGRTAELRIEWERTGVSVPVRLR